MQVLIQQELRWSLWFCISNNLPVDIAAAGLWSGAGLLQSFIREIQDTGLLSWALTLIFGSFFIKWTQRGPQKLHHGGGYSPHSLFTEWGISRASKALPFFHQLPHSLLLCQVLAGIWRRVELFRVDQYNHFLGRSHFACNELPISQLCLFFLLICLSAYYLPKILQNFLIYPLYSLLCSPDRFFDFILILSFQWNLWELRGKKCMGLICHFGVEVLLLIS